MRTPIIDYGNEIWIGDDISLRDRNWRAYSNAVNQDRNVGLESDDKRPPIYLHFELRIRVAVCRQRSVDYRAVLTENRPA